MREQDNPTVGRLDWRVQRPLAEEDGHDGAGIDTRTREGRENGLA